MRHLKSIYVCVLIVLQFFVAQLYGQLLPLQSFSLAANNFVSNQLDGLQVDWRLDLGLTNIPLDQSNSYHFSAGFLQPTINRFANDVIWEHYNPSIEVKNTLRKDAIVLFSKEPDLILFGFKIFDLYGQVFMHDQTTYRSSYAGRHIHVNGMNNGIYIIQVFYLPEYMTVDGKNNYWVKTLKFIKL